jgi:LCP family protein required for cell wall assembly
MFAVDLVVIGLIVVALYNTLEVVKAAFRPRLLVAAMIGNTVLFGFRVWAVDDAYQLVRRGRIRRFSAAAALVLAVILVGPHAVAGYYDIVHYNFITSTFAEDEVAVTTTTADAAIVASSDETTTTLFQVEAGPVLWDGLERLNILLLGADAGTGRHSIRTDTMIVASIDPESGNVALFSLPRNFAQTPLPEGMGIWGCDCFPRMINGLYVAGIESPQAFPGPAAPSVNAVKGGFGELLGIPIHYYALVTLEGFVGVIDAIGGVTIDVPFTILDETYPHEDGVTVEYLEIPVGEQHLDGHLALGYTRARRHADDYARMGRQRCLVDALLAEADPVALALGYPQLAGVLGDSMETDISLSRIPDLIDLLPSIDLDNLISIRFIPPEYRSGFDATGLNIPKIDLIREHVQVVINSTPEEARQILGIEQIDDACSG